MNKELSPLEAFRKHKLTLSQLELLIKDIFVADDTPIKDTLKDVKKAQKLENIIETALERLEHYDKIFKDNVLDDCETGLAIANKLIEHINNYKEKSKKQDEILRIIKERKVNVGCLIGCIENNIEYTWTEVPKQELDLLKEWLK